MRDTFLQGARPEHNSDRRPREHGTPRPARSQFAINLGRLGEALEFDLLAAALGIPEASLRGIVTGREHVRDAQARLQMEYKLFDAGFPEGWLGNQYAKIHSDNLNALRLMAAESSTKAPIRRENFKKIVSAFKTRLSLLADALEVIEPSIMNVANGLLELDEQRFGHTNPRLMAAGFPNGWLERPNAELTEELVLGLERLATDSYESTFDDEDDDDVIQHTSEIEDSTPAAESNALPPSASSNTVTTINEPIYENNTMTIKTQVQPPTAQQPAPLALPIPNFAAATMPTLQQAPQLGQTTLKLPRSALAVGQKPQVGTAGVHQSSPTPKGGRTSNKAPISKEASAARADALEKLLENARRGAKVTLWRDLLGKSLPYAGNITRGTVLFRDDLARDVESVLELPQGWLDNPTFPPISMAAWVTNANVPLPSNRSIATQEVPEPMPTVAPLEQITAMPPEEQSIAEQAPVVTPAAPKQTAKPTPPQAEVIVTKATELPQPSAPVLAQTHASHAPTELANGIFAWTPATDPAMGTPGPLVQAVISIMSKLACDGKFTEDDALRFIYFLMSRQ